MNARMKLIARERASRFVVCADVAGGEGRLPGKWARLQNRLKRMLLLLQSPIASFRWAQAKRKAAARKKQNSVPNWLGPWTNSFAECERDGIVIGL